MHDGSVLDFFFEKWVFVGRKNIFMIDYLYKENTLQQEKGSTQLKSWKDPYSFFRNM